MRCKQPDSGCTRESCVWADRILKGEFPPVAKRNFPRKTAHDENKNGDGGKFTTVTNGKNSAKQQLNNGINTQNRFNVIQVEEIIPEPVIDKPHEIRNVAITSPNKRRRTEMRRSKKASGPVKTSPLTESQINFNDFKNCNHEMFKNISPKDVSRVTLEMVKIIKAVPTTRLFDPNPPIPLKTAEQLEFEMDFNESRVVEAETMPENDTHPDDDLNTGQRPLPNGGGTVVLNV